MNLADGDGMVLKDTFMVTDGFRLTGACKSYALTFLSDPALYLKVHVSSTFIYTGSFLVELKRLFGDEIEQFEDRDGTDEVVMLRTVRQQQSLSSHGSNSVLSSPQLFEIAFISKGNSKVFEFCLWLTRLSLKFEVVKIALLISALACI